MSGQFWTRADRRRAFKTQAKIEKLTLAEYQEQQAQRGRAVAQMIGEQPCATCGRPMKLHLDRDKVECPPTFYRSLWPQKAVG